MPKPLVALIVSAVVCAIAAPTMAAIPTGAIVQTWHYDPVSQNLSIRVVNTSMKIVTAYDLALKITYADKTTNTFFDAKDMLAAFLNGRGGFAPNDARDVLFPQQKPVADLVVDVDVVMYADRTADVLNQLAYERMIAGRQGEVLALQKVNEVVSQMLSDPKVSDPTAAAIAELTREADVLKGSNIRTAEADPQARMELHIRNAIRNMEVNVQLSPQDRRNYLRLLTQRNEARISSVNPHTLLTKGGPQ
jgi:hypothetical protein